MKLAIVSIAVVLAGCATQDQQPMTAEERAAAAAMLMQMQSAPAYRPYQHTPYMMPGGPQQTNCTSMWNGAAVQTVCR